MYNDVALLVDAINGMGKTDIARDYILPLVFLMAGAVFAYIATNYQRYLDIQKEKMDVANDLLFGAQEAFHVLVTIKNRYAGKLTEDPFERAGSVPEMTNLSQPLELPINKLSFILQSKLEILDSSDDYRSPAYISCLQTNFNELLQCVNDRNISTRNIIDKLIPSASNVGAIASISVDYYFTKVSKQEHMKHVDLTELLVKNTDELLIEFHNLLCKFPDVCKYTIDTQRIKHYGKIIGWHYEKRDIFKKSPPVNMQKMVKIYRTSEDDVRGRFLSGFEDQASAYNTKPGTTESERTIEAIESYNRDNEMKRHHKKWW